MPLYNPAPIVPDWSTSFGVYGVSPVTRTTGYTNSSGVAGAKSLAAYAANNQGSAFSGGLLDLLQAARLTDLNTTRVALENLRTMTEAVAAQHNQLIADLKLTGLIG